MTTTDTVCTRVIASIEFPVGTQTSYIESGIDSYQEQGFTATINVPGAAAADYVSILEPSILLRTRRRRGLAYPLGTYTVQYQLGYPTADYPIVTRNRTIMVQDTVAPLLTLLGEKVIRLQPTQRYTDEQGVVAYDAYDGAVNWTRTQSLQNISYMHTTLNLTYCALDMSGNRGCVFREIITRDTLAPTFGVQLNPVTLNATDSYQPLDLTALDDVDGNISCQVYFEMELQDSWRRVSLDGLSDADGYRVCYEATDLSGNTGVFCHAVTVVSTSTSTGRNGNSGFPWWILGLIAAIIAAGSGLFWYCYVRRTKTDFTRSKTSVRHFTMHPNPLYRAEQMESKSTTLASCDVPISPTSGPGTIDYYNALTTKPPNEYDVITEGVGDYEATPEIEYKDVLLLPVNAYYSSNEVGGASNNTDYQDAAVNYQRAGASSVVTNTGYQTVDPNHHPANILANPGYAAYGSSLSMLDSALDWQTISRRRAEHVLRQATQPGSYLVRFSSRCSAHVISMKLGANKFVHHVVATSQDQVVVDGKPTPFSSLPELLAAEEMENTYLECQPRNVVLPPVSAQDLTYETLSSALSHGDIPRAQAEEKLHAVGVAGAFLIRTSNKHQTDVVSLLKASGKCAHHRIVRLSDGRLAVDGKATQERTIEALLTLNGVFAADLSLGMAVQPGDGKLDSTGLDDGQSVSATYMYGSVA
jgi:hypothetical protein